MFKGTVKNSIRELWVMRITAAEDEIASYAGNVGCAGHPPVTRGEVFPTSQYSYWGPMWGIWFATNGKFGEEPPKEVERLMEIRDEIIKESSTKRRTELSKEALAIHAENFWQIGIAREPAVVGRFIVAKNNFRNTGDKPIAWDAGAFVAAQFFFKK